MGIHCILFWIGFVFDLGRRDWMDEEGFLLWYTRYLVSWSYDLALSACCCVGYPGEWMTEWMIGFQVENVHDNFF